MIDGDKRDFSAVERLFDGVWVYLYYCFRRGLDAREWLYFREFLLALRNGEYNELDDEGSEEDGED